MGWIIDRLSHRSGSYEKSETSGGLTRGRGLTEQQRLIWLLSMPACAETNYIMQELTGVQFNSGEQNKDMTKARQTRDMKDTMTILSGLATHRTFSLDGERNIMNGVNADNNDADTAKGVREKILSSMNETLVTDQTKCPGNHYGIEVLRED